MKRVLLASLSAVALTFPSAANAAFTVTFANNLAIPALNDFQSALAALGQTRFTTSGTISLSNAANVTFEYLGSESGFTDRFAAGTVSGFENNANNFSSPVMLGTGSFGAGVFAPVFTTSGSALSSIPGMDSFGILLGTLTAGGGSFSSNVLYFAFDDQINSVDDDHDDFIVRATINSAVPEPSTWAMMLLGFGAVGYSLRSRRRTTQQSFS
jgi:PEP-CTERM motif